MRRCAAVQEEAPLADLRQRWLLALHLQSEAAARHGDGESAAVAEAAARRAAVEEEMDAECVAAFNAHRDSWCVPPPARGAHAARRRRIGRLLTSRWLRWWQGRPGVRGARTRVRRRSERNNEL